MIHFGKQCTYVPKHSYVVYNVVQYFSKYVLQKLRIVFVKQSKILKETGLRLSLKNLSFQTKRVNTNARFNKKKSTY